MYTWLRENPHRLHLGQVGLRLRVNSTDRAIQPADISGIEQKLDLWSGILTSRFTLAGEAVMVKTAVHPELDVLAVQIDSVLIGSQQLAVRFAFPYGSPEMAAAVWDKTDRHRSEVIRQSRNSARI